MDTDGERLSKAALTRASSNMHHLGDISVPRLPVPENEEAGLDLPVKARGVKDSVVLPLVWKSPDAMTYVKLGTRFLNVRRLGALPG